MSRFALLSVTPIFVAVLAAGCDRDVQRYAYGDCNNGGCFGCTDNSQQSCWPLPYDPCRSTVDCGEGRTCTTLGCAARCGSDADCRQGEVCTSGGYCAPGNAKSNPVDGSDGGNNQSDPGVIPCVLDSHCFPGETCVSGACTHSPTCGIPATLCASAADCGTGRSCVAGFCHLSCGGGVACPVGQACASGTCLDSADLAQCVFDIDCGASARCINRACHPLCGVDSQCGRNEFCDSGVCRADVRPAASVRR